MSVDVPVEIVTSCVRTPAKHSIDINYININELYFICCILRAERHP
jgi:hypothetical protein